MLTVFNCLLFYNLKPSAKLKNETGHQGKTCENLPNQRGGAGQSWFQYIEIQKALPSRQLQERNPFFLIIICLTHVNLWRHTSKLFVWESVDLRIFWHRYSCWDGWRKIPFPCLFSSNPVSKAKSFLPQSEKLVECTFWRWAGHRIGQIPLLPG